MIGWSRKSAESAARQRRHREWFATLTEEEKKKYLEERERRDRAEQKFFMTRVYPTMAVVFAILFVIAWFLDHRK